MKKTKDISTAQLHDAPSYKGAPSGDQYKSSNGGGYEQDYDIMAAYEKSGGIVYDEPTPHPEHYYAVTNSKDYDRGYIRRYFIVKYDGATVTEVSKKWLADNGKKCPNIYSKHTIQWFVTDYSKEKIEKGMKSPKAKDRNEYLVKQIKNEFLRRKLQLNYLDLFMG